MEESAKYLIHADVTASGVVEREDVVGAVYGQTEGLLGEELDLRHLQEASKVGRIDVDVDSEGGRSFGELTIATSMDRVETAVLAASLETIGRVGPCRAEFRVTAIEDVRAAKRREVVERAKELLAESFDEPAASSQEILEEVREAVRVADITEYEGLPAGPNVEESDAVVVVEGRADVLTLLQYGIKNAVAVEGTDVPEQVADLTADRTVTAFLDGDRGGDLILEELSQVGEVDYVALAPPDRSVEDLDRVEVLTALREKVPYERIEAGDVEVATVPTDGGTVSLPGRSTGQSPEGEADSSAGSDPECAAPVAPGEMSTAADADASAGDADTEPAPGHASAGETGAAGRGDDSAPSMVAEDGSDDETESGTAEDDGVGDTEDGPTEDSGDADTEDGPAANDQPRTLHGHVDAVVGEGAGTVRLLDDEFGSLAEAPADEAFERLEAADPAPAAVVLDGTLTQRVLDVAAQRGVGQVVARAVGDLVKQPVGVRILTADELRQDV